MLIWLLSIIIMIKETRKNIQKFLIHLLTSSLELFQLCFGQSQYLLTNLFQCRNQLSFLTDAAFFVTEEVPKMLNSQKSFSVCLLRNNGWYRKYMWKSLSKMERVFGIKPKIVFGDSLYLFHDLSVQFGRNLFSDLSRDSFPVKVYDS